MLVMCYGVTKSGSTLAFELAKKALESAGYEQPVLSDSVVDPGRRVNFISNVTSERIKALVKEIGGDRIIAVKTHVGLSPETVELMNELARTGDAKVHTVVRDPRDVCLSLLDAGAKARQKGKEAFAEVYTLEDASANVVKQLERLRCWGSINGALILDYKQAAFSPEEALIQIEQHLGITCDHAAVIDKVMNQTFTQKNKGVKDRYISELSEGDKETLKRTFGEFITKVCEARDYSWFGRSAMHTPTVDEKGEMEGKGAVGKGPTLPVNATSADDIAAFLISAARISRDLSASGSLGSDQLSAIDWASLKLVGRQPGILIGKATRLIGLGPKNGREHFRRLQREGFISLQSDRSAGDADAKRLSALDLTAAGRRVLEQADEGMQKFVERISAARPIANVSRTSKLVQNMSRTIGALVNDKRSQRPQS
jgi:DNA-binding MarR family transcriptional regulator